MRPCPLDCGAQSARLASGAETERRDAAAGRGGEAGLVTRPWVHVNTAGRRSPALPPPNHRSRRAGVGRGPEASRSPPAPATTKWPLALALAQARASRAAGRRRRLPEGARSLAQPPVASASAPSSERTQASQPGAQRRPPASGRDLSLPLRSVSRGGGGGWGSKLPLPYAQRLLLFSACDSK